jgi:ABC-type branched-subunit amino acid transport system ATPase component
VKLGIARTLQIPAVFSGLTVLESAIVGAANRGHASGLVRTLLPTPRQRAEAAALTGTAHAALTRVGLDSQADEPAERLSLTEQRLLMIAIALATDPAVLLLDEPAAGIGAGELPRLAAVIRQAGMTTILVEHNLGFVHAVAHR